MKFRTKDKIWNGRGSPLRCQIHSTFEKKILKKDIGAKQNSGFFFAHFSSLSAACWSKRRNPWASVNLMIWIDWSIWKIGPSWRFFLLIIFFMPIGYSRSNKIHWKIQKTLERVSWIIHRYELPCDNTSSGVDLWHFCDFFLWSLSNYQWYHLLLLLLHQK